MKKIYLLSFLISCLFLSALGAKGNTGWSMHNECVDEDGQIALSGDLPASTKQRSLTQSIHAYKNDFFVSVNFLSNLGTIDIYIYNEYGVVVYQEAVNTAVEQQVSIDITSLSSGEYTIMFVNSQNRYMQGSFEI